MNFEGFYVHKLELKTIKLHNFQRFVQFTWQIKYVWPLLNEFWLDTYYTLWIIMFKQTQGMDADFKLVWILAILAYNSWKFKKILSLLTC